MEELDHLARRQWGLLTHEQVLNHVTRHELAWMLKTRRLLNMHRGIYRMAGAPITWQQEAAAALMALPFGVASHFTAARLHGLPFGDSELPHVTLPKTSSHVRSDIEIHRSDIPDSQIVVTQRITCTTVERTIVDLAGELRRPQLAFLIDEAVIGNKTTFAKVADALSAYETRGRKGVRSLNALLKERLPLAEGFDQGIELKVLKAAKKAKLPQPRTQHKVLTKYGPYFVDAAWPGQMVGAESDGFSVHSASRKRHNEDRRRRNELETLGWKILSFTFDMKVDEVAAVLKANVSTEGG